MKTYHLLGGNMVPDVTGIWVLRAHVGILQRQLDEVTYERDQYKAACALADALRNRERGLLK